MILVGVILAVGALAFVLWPLLASSRRPESPAEHAGEALSPEAERALAALRELEFEHATGKLADADYERLRAEYAGLAGAAGPTPPPATPPAADDEVEAFIQAVRAMPAACPTCGPRPESDAVFCSNCGRALGGSCQHCGAPAGGAEARFCAACGAQFAPPR